MTLPPSLPSASPDKVALSWLTTAAGAALFVTFQLFFYVNDFVRAHGTTTAITLPGVFAIAATWRRIKNKGNRHVDE